MKGACHSHSTPYPPPCHPVSSADDIVRYTSLGSTYNTFKNPALLIPAYETSAPSHAPTADTVPGAIKKGTHGLNGHAARATPPSRLPTSRHDSYTGTGSPVLITEAEKRYRPAYELLDGSLERAGRGKAPS